MIKINKRWRFIIPGIILVVVLGALLYMIEVNKETNYATTGYATYPSTSQTKTGILGKLFGSKSTASSSGEKSASECCEDLRSKARCKSNCDSTITSKTEKTKCKLKVDALSASGKCSKV